MICDDTRRGLLFLAGTAPNMPAIAAHGRPERMLTDRKIWKLLRKDGLSISQSSVKRAMARRGLLMPRRYQGELRALARARKAVFSNPPQRRNRVWQSDFSEFETDHGGFWQLSGYVDYATKMALALDNFPTKTAHDALRSLKAAIAEAERLLGKPLGDDCVDADTGELFPLVIVTDIHSVSASEMRVLASWRDENRGGRRPSAVTADRSKHGRCS